MSSWQREQWATLHINARCGELERDLAGVMKDPSLTVFQRGVLCHLAIAAAAEDLAGYDAFRAVPA